LRQVLCFSSCGPSALANISRRQTLKGSSGR
jgi:hypothetical protein